MNNTMNKNHYPRTSTSIRRLCFMLVALACGAISAQANLISNGGFESPTVVGPLTYNYRTGTQLTGWTEAGSVNGIVHFDTGYRAVSEGNQAAQIETSGGSISQSLTTVIGDLYQVSFDLSAFFYTSPTATLGVAIGSYSATYIGSHSSYTSYVFDFIANSVASTLTFSNAGLKDTFPHLDNVSMVNLSATSSVPDAGNTAALIGLGMLCLIAVRRKQVRSSHKTEG